MNPLQLAAKIINLAASCRWWQKNLRRFPCPANRKRMRDYEQELDEALAALYEKGAPVVCQEKPPEGK